MTTTTMVKLRWRFGVLAVAVFALANSMPGHAQTGVAKQGVQVIRQDAQVVRQDAEVDRYVYYGHTAVRAWQNYLLRAGDGVRNVVVIGGDADIQGQVSRDVQVIVGDVRLGATAIIDGSLVVTGGDVWVTEGAVVRRDLAIIGGVLHAPEGFSPGASHFAFGAENLGRALRALTPWVTRGLLWGRLIVPSIGWVWTVVFAMLIVTLALNLLLHQPVGACAAVLSARPYSAFMTGLLVLLLAGPLSALMAVTIIGIALVPFLICAVVVAWIVGKVGVSRWIGATIMPSDSDSRLVAMRAVVIGFAAISLMYMVPVLGLVTWAMISVFGLGAASLAFVGALRRERPARKPRGTPPPPVAAAFEPEPARSAPVYDPPPPPPPPPAYAEAALPPLAADLRGFPRAQFVDRLAAAALDAVLLVLFNNIVRFGYGGDDSRFLLALLYFVVFWAWKGTTLGGIICNLRLTRVDGAPLRFSDALVRGLAGIFSIAALGLGFLWILRDPERQAWHDRIAGTYVVKVPRDWPLP